MAENSLAESSRPSDQELTNKRKLKIVIRTTRRKNKGGKPPTGSDQQDTDNNQENQRKPEVDRAGQPASQKPGLSTANPAPRAGDDGPRQPPIGDDSQNQPSALEPNSTPTPETDQSSNQPASSAQPNSPRQSPDINKQSRRQIKKPGTSGNQNNNQVDQRQSARRPSLDSSLGNKIPATPPNNNQPATTREPAGPPQAARDEQATRRQLQTQIHAQRLQQAASQKQKAARQSAQKKTEKTDTIWDIVQYLTGFLGSFGEWFVSGPAYIFIVSFRWLKSWTMPTGAKEEESAASRTKRFIRQISIFLTLLWYLLLLFIILVLIGTIIYFWENKLEAIKALWGEGVAAIAAIVKEFVKEL